mgnify:CR=1 FL=1
MLTAFRHYTHPAPHCVITEVSDVTFGDLADRPEAQPLAQRYASVVPAEGSVVDMLIRARDKQTGQLLKPHQIVAQVSTYYGLVVVQCSPCTVRDCCVVSTKD